MEKSKIKKTVLVVLIAMLIFAAGFFTCFFISKLSYTNATSRLAGILNIGQGTSSDIYTELEYRIKELDTYRAQLSGVGTSIDNCIELTKQTESALEELRGSVDAVGATSSSIGETIRKLQQVQSEINAYVIRLEADNRRLEQELRGIQSSVSQQ